MCSSFQGVFSRCSTVLVEEHDARRVHPGKDTSIDDMHT